MKRGLILTVLLTFAVRAFAQGSQSGVQVADVKAASRSASGQASATLTPSQIFSLARPSVVVIVASDENQRREALGSGFIVSQGRIATNHHVVAGMNQAFAIFSDGNAKPIVKVVADSVEQDLVVLEVETGNRRAVKFGDELSLQQGDSVYALGAPKGLELTFTNGIVSSFRKSNAQFLIQATAPIAPGSSGGPLFDGTGRVVGVTTSMLSDAPGIYFSVGVDDLKRLLRTLQAVAVPFGEWARQQAKPQSDRADTPADDGTDSEQLQSEWVRLQGSVRLLEKLSEAHGFSLSMGRMRRNLFESGFIITPSHPCAGDIVYEGPNKVLLLNLANVDAASIQVDSSSVKFNSTLFLEAETLYQLQEGEQRSGGISVVLDSRENAQEFARLLSQATVVCQERKGRGQSF